MFSGELLAAEHVRYGQHIAGASRGRLMSLEKLAQFSDDPQAKPNRIAAA